MRIADQSGTQLNLDLACIVPECGRLCVWLIGACGMNRVSDGSADAVTLRFSSHGLIR
jgi:hypothetical protein